MAHIRLGLARLGVYDTGGFDAGSENLIDFGLRRTVEAGAEGGKKADYLRVGVAFYS